MFRLALVILDTLPMFAFFEKKIDPYPEAPPRPVPRNLWAFVWQCTEGGRGAILVMTLMTAITGVFEASLYAIIGYLTDWLAAISPARLWAEEGRRLFWLAVLLLGSIAIVIVGALYKHQVLSSALPMRLRWNFHRLMLSQSMGFYQDEFAGRVSAKVMQTALAARDAVMIVTDILVYVLIYFLTLAGVVASFHPLILLPFLGWLFCYGLALAFFVPRIARISRQQADANSLVMGRITDAYTNISTVKLFSHSRREAGYTRAAMQELFAASCLQRRLISGMEITVHSLCMLLALCAAGVALSLWSRGAVGVGAVVAACGLALRLNGMSFWIMWEMATLFGNIGTIMDGMQTLSSAHLVVDKPDAPPLRVTQGEIRFEDVCFAYATADKAADKAPRPVVERFNLVIRPGERIGVVGPSGAGKSTLVNLLLRFYDLQSGAIRIDGQDIAAVTQESLRQQIGMVTQDTSLLHRSVRDNLLYGRPDASEAEMLAAARNAQAHEFIETLVDPKGRRGYEAHVGERGVKLSGGQRQRVAIARVMLKDAPILLLDEATSALDSEVEAVIQGSLARLMEGKTVIAIAHRLSTIAAMDRLIVLEHGHIVEEGRHADLLAQNGLYARLWKRQSGGFLLESEEERGEQENLAGT
jgi:ATP-binding cassette subfamily B multidrug efflux pump